MDCQSCIKRRDFLLMSLAAAAAAGCQSVGGGGAGGMPGPRTVNAGPAANYSADGVYSTYRDLGFFIIHRGGKLEALSSICTHRNCKLTAEEDHTFYCGCHGSEFDQDGKVTDGPATRNLPVLPSHTDGAGHLIVTVPGAG
jgi:Rieske Fe-S protein